MQVQLASFVRRGSTAESTPSSAAREDGDCSLVHPWGFPGKIDLLPQLCFWWDVFCDQLLPLSSPTSALGPWFDVLRMDVGTAAWMVRGNALCSLDGFQGVAVTVGV